MPWGDVVDDFFEMFKNVIVGFGVSGAMLADVDVWYVNHIEFPNKRMLPIRVCTVG